MPLILLTVTLSESQLRVAQFEVGAEETKAYRSSCRHRHHKSPPARDPDYDQAVPTRNLRRARRRLPPSGYVPLPPVPAAQYPIQLQAGFGSRYLPHPPRSRLFFILRISSL